MKLSMIYLLLSINVFAQSELKRCIMKCEEKQEAFNLSNKPDPLRIIPMMCDNQSNIEKYYQNNISRLTLERFKKSVNYYCNNEQLSYLICIKQECPRQ